MTSIHVAVKYVLDGDRLHGVRAYRISEEWAGALALRATSFLEYVCAASLWVAQNEHERADELAANAERRRPSGRRVHSVAQSQLLREDAARHREFAAAAESVALSAIGEADLVAAHRAVAHVSEARTNLADHEWVNALEVKERIRKSQRKRMRWQFVSGRAQQAPQPHGGILPLARFERHQLGAEPLSRHSESGHPGTVGSAVELIARWDLGADARASADPTTAALEALRGVRRGEHTESGIGRAAAMMRTAESDDLDEFEWEEGGSDETLAHIAEMRARISRCFERFGRPVQPGTWAVHSERFHLDGHIDFVTPHTIWDLKVSDSAPDRTDILQLLLYWLMFRDEPAIGGQITYIGIYNPRLDIAWRMSVAAISTEVLVAVESLALSEP